MPSRPATRLGRYATLSALTIAAALGALARVCAQESVPEAKDLYVVPAAVYEPAHPTPVRPEPVIPASFKERRDGSPSLAEDEESKPTNSGGYGVWSRVEYVNWRITGPPIEAPLITTNTPPNIGALDEPGTRVLFGAGSGPKPQFGNFPGVRAAIGGYLEEDTQYAWELSGFGLPRRTINFAASSAGGAAPVVSIPFFATQAFGVNPAGETALNSGGAPSAATVILNSQMWGVEIDEFVSLWGDEHSYGAIFFGLRYLNLIENLTLNHQTFDTATGGSVLVTDGFATRNQYVGGNLGFRSGVSWRRWNLDTNLILGIGSINERLDIAGATTVSGSAFGFVNGTTVGGVFAQASNIGTTQRQTLAFLPEAQFRIGYAITRYIQPFVSYNAMWLSSVARPGNQIDRSINPTQNAFFASGVLTGAAAPIASIHTSDMWIQGLTFGVEIRY